MHVVKEFLPHMLSDRGGGGGKNDAVGGEHRAYLVHVRAGGDVRVQRVLAHEVRAPGASRSACPWSSRRGGEEAGRTA